MILGIYIFLISGVLGSLGNSESLPVPFPRLPCLAQQALTLSKRCAEHLWGGGVPGVSQGDPKQP